MATCSLFASTPSNSYRKCKGEVVGVIRNVMTGEVKEVCDKHAKMFAAGKGLVWQAWKVSKTLDN